MAGQLLRGRAGARDLPRRGAGAGSRGVGRPRRRESRPAERAVFSSFMVNAWIVGTIVAVVAGAVGFFVVVARLVVRRARAAQRLVRGRGGRGADRDQHVDRAGRLRVAGRARDRAAGPPRSPRCRDRAGAGADARARLAVSSPQLPVRAGGLLAAVRRDPRDRLQSACADDRTVGRRRASASRSCTGR